MHFRTVALASLLAVTGCSGFGMRFGGSGGMSDDSDADGWGSEADDSSYEPPAECMPEAKVFAELKQLHADTEGSVHELIKCGGLQARISRTFLVVVVASNRDLFDEA